MKAVFKNLGRVLIRTMAVVFVLKLLLNYLMANQKDFIPSYKEIILFPIIVIRFLLVHSYRFVRYNVLEIE